MENSNYARRFTKTSRRLTYIQNGMLTLSRAAMRQLCFVQEMAHIDQADLMHMFSHSLITFVSLFFPRLHCEPTYNNS